MDLAGYQSQIAAQAGVLRAAAVSVPADAGVPTCPGWTVQQLLQHLGRVFDMVVRVVRTADPQLAPGRLEPSEGSVLELFDDRLATMLKVLADTDPATPAWHYSPVAPKTAAFWSRRMAHEVTVHRIDAQAATGAGTEVAPELAADGVDERLTWLIPARPERYRAVGELHGSVRYRALDLDRAWTVQLAAGQPPRTTPGPTPGEADAAVDGRADAVYRAAWGRPSNAVISGNLALVEAIRAMNS